MMISPKVAERLAGCRNGTEIHDEDGDYLVLVNRIIDKHRWETIHEVIFQSFEEGTPGHAPVPNGAWRFTYAEGATEEQETDWPYGDDVQCTPVRPEMVMGFVKDEQR